MAYYLYSDCKGYVCQKTRVDVGANGQTYFPTFVQVLATPDGSYTIVRDMYYTGTRSLDFFTYDADRLIWSGSPRSCGGSMSLDYYTEWSDGGSYYFYQYGSSSFPC